MHMKKKSLPILMLALSMLAPMAAQAEDGVLIQQQSGECVGYAFSSNPKISFTSTELIMEAGDVKVSYALEGLKIKFGTLPSAIQNIDGADVKFRLTGSQIVATGLAKGQPLTVSTLNGMQVGKTKAATDGQATLSLQGLKQGVYIIHTGKTTYKFTKK